MLGWAASPHNLLCNGCAMAKAYRKKFGQGSRPKATRTLEWVWADLGWTRNRQNCFLLVLDEHSRMVFALVLKNASEAPEKFIELRDLLESDRHPLKMKWFATDEDPMWKSNKWKAYEKSSRLTHFFYGPYRKESLIERAAKTVGGGARASMVHGSAPDKHFIDALCHQAYVVCRIPHSAHRNEENLNARRPISKWYGTAMAPSKKIDAGIIFCLCYAYVDAARRRKNEARAQPCIYLGLREGHRGFKVMFINTQKQTFRSDVKFVNDHFPFRARISITPSAITVEEEEADGSFLDDQTATAMQSYKAAFAPQTNKEVVNHAATATRKRKRGDEPSPNKSPMSDVERRRTLTSVAMPTTKRNTHQNKNESPKRSDPPLKHKKAQEVLPSTNWDSLPATEKASRLRDLPDPKNFREALAAPDAQLWIEGDNNEYAQASANWKLVDPSEARGHHIFKRQVVRKRKFTPGTAEKPDGEWIKNKVRYTIAAFTKMLRNGVHYREKFAPTPRIDSLRLLLSLVAYYDWDLELNDIVGFFLQAMLEKGEKVFMYQIPHRDDGTGRILQLIGNLYGLPQAPYHAQRLLKLVLKSKNFKELASDISAYIKLADSGERQVIASIHVDDAVCGGPPSTINLAREALMSRFRLVTTPNPTVVLGIQVERVRKLRWMKLHQRDFIIKLLSKWRMGECRARSTPLRVPLEKDPEPRAKDTAKDLKFRGYYREIVGSLLWLSTRTRPDLAFAVNYHSRYSHVARAEHFQRLKWTLAYLKGTVDYGLVYHFKSDAQRPPVLHGATDADFAGDTNTSRTTAGGMLAYGPTLLTYWSKRLNPVVTSTAQAETYALQRWIEEKQWISDMLEQMKEPATGPVTVLCDNNATIANAHGHSDKAGSKHYRVAQHFIRQNQENGKINVARVDSANNPADFFTKSLPLAVFEKHRTYLMGNQDKPTQKC